MSMRVTTVRGVCKCPVTEAVSERVGWFPSHPCWSHYSNIPLLNFSLVASTHCPCKGQGTERAVLKDEKRKKVAFLLSKLVLN